MEELSMCLVRILNSNFNGNTANATRGGAIGYLEVSFGNPNYRFIVNGCNFTNNQALNGSAINIFTVSHQNISLSNNIFTNNHAIDGGGAIYKGTPGTVHLNNCIFKGNLVENMVTVELFTMKMVL
jgi:hypothetical protein